VAAENKSPDSLPDTQPVIFQHVDPSDSSKDAFGTAILSCYGLPAMSTLAEFASAVTVYRNVKSSKELRAVGQLVDATNLLDLGVIDWDPFLEVHNKEHEDDKVTSKDWLPVKNETSEEREARRERFSDMIRS
jgi:hypothetical protein